MYADDGYNTQLPSEWKRANDEDLDGSGADWYNLSSDELSEIDEDISQFIKQDAMGPVPHFRVFIMSSGKMELLPKSRYRIKYHGIPTATREQVTALKATVQKMAISMRKFDYYLIHL